MPGRKSVKTEGDLELPVARIKAIVTNQPDVNTINDQGAYVMTKAVEMLVADLAKAAHDGAKNKKILEYEDIAKCVNDTERFEFLRHLDAIHKCKTSRSLEAELLKMHLFDVLVFMPYQVTVEEARAAMAERAKELEKFQDDPLMHIYAATTDDEVKKLLGEEDEESEEDEDEDEDEEEGEDEDEIEDEDEEENEPEDEQSEPEPKKLKKEEDLDDGECSEEY
ncbi:hypothetical protein L596_029699 [Steinernema carpocapsae]|uniref:Transcription factor CBF/NF-Y/archaeal histone domain-containing protein n=1 Tax=Steinernema carpocapsae TaxID=34508 RepID=A0A4U5LQI9_STECR|nr:hypothetical protein L596_029699 [Steinernema carpocapsae]